MVGRRWQLDPEVAAVAGERLRRLVQAQQGSRSDDAAARRARDPGPEADLVGLDERESVEALDLPPPPRRFTRWHLGVVVAVLLVGLGWGGWSLLRARPVAVAAPAAVQTAVVADPTSTPAAAGPVTPRPTLVVHVLGAVREPGLVRLPDGSRVQDAIDAAGGLTRSADPGELNLAQTLGDGQQVVIGTKGHASGEVRDGSGAGSTSGGGSSSGGGAGGGSGTVDLNRATLAQLDELPGVGPVTAQKILDWRQQHDRFSRVEELQEVDGIGPKTYARLAPHVRV